MKTNNNKIIYYLTGQADQIRKASRSVCANLKEAWSKRRYIAHFTSKLIPTYRDDGENACRPCPTCPKDFVRRAAGGRQAGRNRNLGRF